MTHTIKTITLLATLGTLAACGGAGGDGGGKPPVVDEPTAPSITSGNVTGARSFISGVSSRRDTPEGSFLPFFSTATYTGEMVTGLTINGEDSVDGLIGDVSITAELLGAGDDVTGTITNLHTLDGNTPVERLTGQLAISGDLDDDTKLMTSTISGQLNGVVGDGVRGNMNIAGTMNGRTQDTRNDVTIPNPIPGGAPIVINTTYDVATGIYGNASGSITGSESGSFSGTWAVSE